MLDDPPPRVVPAHPGHVALYAENGTLCSNRIVAWEISDSAWPVTLYEGEDPFIAIAFPDGHIESLDGRRRWGSLAEFCKAHRFKIPAKA